MSRARTLASILGSDGALNAGDVSGLAAVATSGSASDLSTGTLPIARVADGAVTNAKLSTDLDASKLAAGTLPIARLDVATLVTKAPVCYARGQINTTQADTTLNIDPQYKQSVVYFRAYATKSTDSANYYNGYTSLHTGSTYGGSSTPDTAVEWNGWLLTRGSGGASPVLVAETVAATRWNRWLPASDYGQDCDGVVTVNQNYTGNRASIIWDINYTKSNVGATRSMGSGHKTSNSDPINGLQFDWDPGGTGSNPNIYIDYYIVGVK